MKRRILLTLILLSGAMFAQNYVDLARLHYLGGAASKFDSSQTTSTYQELGIQITLPVKLNEKTAIITGLMAEEYRFKVSSLSSSLTKFHSNALTIGVSHKFEGNWSVIGTFLPRLTTTYLHSAESKDYQSVAVGLLKYKKKENLKYNIGMLYVQDPGGPLFVPLFGLYYISPNKKFESNLVLPIWGSANYRVAKKFNIGVNMKSFIRSFYMGPSTDTYLTLNSTELMSFLRFDVTKSVLIEGKVGYSFLRSTPLYQWGDRYSYAISAFKIGDERKELNTSFENGLIYKVRLIYRFHL